ncbi:MAG: Ldh family oxidoreductase [Desulfuromusa sp.]|nr:Ldh family oxidoreductase [Desulfuromusa sp.]
MRKKGNSVDRSQHDGNPPKYVPAQVLRDQLILVFRSWGMGEEHINHAVEAMVAADLWGIDSHGISMLMQYEEMFRDGKLEMKSEPRIVRDSAVMALIDGAKGLGHIVATIAMNMAVDKCLAAGIGVVSVFNSTHFGAAGYYALKAAQRGVIGIVMTSTRSVLVVPTFGCEPVLGTNPIAFAAPTERNPPFLLDMSTSTVASNKVKVYELNNWDLPEGWVVDENGGAVSDPVEARQISKKQHTGGLTPLGGTRDLGSHKGYGLSVMVQILASTLAGASFSPIRNNSQEKTEPENIGHFFLAIDPKAFRVPGAFENDLDQIIDILHSSQPVESGQPVLVAGDPESQTCEKRHHEGIPIPEKLMHQLRKVAERSSVPFLLNDAKDSVESDGVMS